MYWRITMKFYKRSKTRFHSMYNLKPIQILYTSNKEQCMRHDWDWHDDWCMTRIGRDSSLQTLCVSPARASPASRQQNTVPQTSDHTRRATLTKVYKIDAWIGIGINILRGLLRKVNRKYMFSFLQCWPTWTSSRHLTILEWCSIRTSIMSNNNFSLSKKPATINFLQTWVKEVQR